jgi:hypothetical protein
MRQRGMQSRRARPESYDLSAGGGRGALESDRFWPVLAIVAIIVAAAGWSAAGALWLGSSGNRSVAQGSALPSDAAALPSDQASPSDLPSDTPEPPHHQDLALEKLLPATWSGTALTAQSWTGDTILSDDPWSQAFTTFLSKSGKKPSDLTVAQAYDPNAGIDLQIGVFKVAGISAVDLRKTMVSAWLASYPDLKTTSLTISKKVVIRGISEQVPTTSFWYEHDGLVYDVETSDEALATAVLATLP